MVIPAGTADLMIRASDHGRTPGEHAAMEEAERCLARGNVSGAEEWRRLAAKAREVDLAGDDECSPLARGRDRPTQGDVAEE